MMEHLVAATEQAATQGNPYAALALALTLPDICGSLENPDRKSSARYQKWWNVHMDARYQPHMTAKDAYALRCSYLHQGIGDVSTQYVRETLVRFDFVQPPPGSVNSMHLYRSDKKTDGKEGRLVLRVDDFCRDICFAVMKWQRTLSETDMAQMAPQLLQIDDLSKGVTVPGFAFFRYAIINDVRMIGFPDADT